MWPGHLKSFEFPAKNFFLETKAVRPLSAENRLVDREGSSISRWKFLKIENVVSNTVLSLFDRKGDTILGIKAVTDAPPVLSQCRVVWWIFWSSCSKRIEEDSKRTEEDSNHSIKLSLVVFWNHFWGTIMSWRLMVSNLYNRSYCMNVMRKKNPFAISHGRMVKRKSWCYSWIWGNITFPTGCGVRLYKRFGWTSHKLSMPILPKPTMFSKGNSRITFYKTFWTTWRPRLDKFSALDDLYSISAMRWTSEWRGVSPPKYANIASTISLLDSRWNFRRRRTEILQNTTNEREAYYVAV